MNCNLLICTNTSKHCSWKRCFFIFQNCNTVTVTPCHDVIVWSGFVDCHYCECASTSSSRLPRHLRFTVLKVNSSADPHNFLRSPLRIAISFSWILSLDFIPEFHSWISFLDFILRFLAMAELKRALFCSFSLTKTFHFMAPFLAMAELKRALFCSSGLTKTFHFSTSMLLSIN